MSSRDWFGVGVRLFGIWLITRGSVYVATLGEYKLGFATAPNGGNPTSLLLYTILDFGLAAVFLLWTRHVVEWTYGEDRASHKSVQGLDSDQLG